MVTTTQDYHRVRNGSTVAKWTITFESGDLTTGSGTNSGVIEWEGFDEMTIYFRHTSDQAITVQVFDAPDVGFNRGNQHQLGTDISLSAGDSTTQIDRQTVSQVSPFARLNASADSSNATTGELEVNIHARGD